MVAEPNASDADSKSTKNRISDLISADGLFGLVLCLIACLLVIIAFWRLSGNSSDMLVVTDYIIGIADGQKRTFGYGGLAQSAESQLKSYTKVDVPFQSPALSSFCFSISKNDGAYWLEGVDDTLQIGGKEIESGNRVQLTYKTRFKTLGRFGGATFTAFLDEKPDRLRLHLDSPIYYKLNSDVTRVTFGLASEMVGSPIDEVIVRTTLENGQTETLIVQKTASDGFILNNERDLARPNTLRSEILLGLNKPDKPSAEASVTSGTPILAGTTVVKPTRNAGTAFFGRNPAWVFGLKLAMVVLLFAIAFGTQGLHMETSQIRLPHGPLIFGCVTVLAVVGIALTARDYFLAPYDQDRFSEYLRCFFIALVLLYSLRIPFESFQHWNWARAYPIFLLVYILLNRPFDGFMTLPSFISLTVFSAAFFGVAVIVHWGMRGVRGFLGVAVGADWRRVLAVFLLPVIAVMTLTVVTGGREALSVFGMRFHLPTFFTPLIVSMTVLAVTAAESGIGNWQKHRSIVLGVVLLTVGLYYLLSRGDHGGTAILGVSALAAMWAAARKNRPWIFTVILASLIVIIVVITVLAGHERIDIAWGGEEGAQRYFDQAVNLRTARDMARAGGIVGAYDQLYVPSSVSMNIYNDLVAAYIAGFFGLIGLLLVAGAYFLFYTRLSDGIFGLIHPKTARANEAPKAVAPIGARGPMPPPFEMEPEDMGVDQQDPAGLRHVVTSYAASLVAVFLFQFLWVFTATLWRRVPISGLDLQPISASVISVMAFVVILLGSVVFVHNVCEAEVHANERRARER